MNDNDDGLNAARGLRNGILISLGLWGIVALWWFS